MQQARTRRRGVTIAELVVAIGIGALLLGILCPLYGGARQRARTLGCDGNLRQLGIALSLYAANHDLRLPPASSAWYADKSKPCIADAVAEYVPDEGVLRCPADDHMYLPSENRTSYHYTEALGGTGINGPWLFELAANYPWGNRVWLVGTDEPGTMIALRDLDPSIHRGSRPSERPDEFWAGNYLFLDGHVEFADSDPWTRIIVSRDRIRSGD
jgi:prepilin-type processing-associated H-X9-DG protein